MPSDRPTKPHGTFTGAAPVGRLLTAAGYAPHLVRKGVGLGGHYCTWDKTRQLAVVGYRCADDLPLVSHEGVRAEMLDLYADVLTSKGYDVQCTDRFLYVHKIKEDTVTAPKPTIEQQLKALAVLRAVSNREPIWLSPYQREEQLKEAIDTLDNAGLFRGLDEESLERES